MWGYTDQGCIHLVSMPGTAPQPPPPPHTLPARDILPNGPRVRLRLAQGSLAPPQTLHTRDQPPHLLLVFNVPRLE
jgi:hypothetical protein